ncbi:MAG: 30S ribosome-binding factor RbfA [Chlamydiales bacterium]|nr:30S ribosome-binding factor RbfA [Chlamydiales bacterium]
MTRRVERLNSLLKEVLSDVIKKSVRNPEVSPLFTITKVNISKDLRHAKVYVSVIGSLEEKTKTIQALHTASGYIGVLASKLIKIRYFPALTFKLDTSIDHHLRIEELLRDIEEEKATRSENSQE